MSKDFFHASHSQSNVLIDLKSFETKFSFSQINESKISYELAQFQLLEGFDKQTIGYLSLLNQSLENIISQKYLFEQAQQNGLIVSGMGGSILGFQTMLQFCQPDDQKLIANRSVAIDTIDPQIINSAVCLIESKPAILNFISKSGDTLETLSAYLILKEKYLSRWGKETFKKNCCIITTTGSGYLYQEAQTESLKVFDIPRIVGGRYSVLSAVGLLPAFLSGLNINAFLSGAKKAWEVFASTEFEHNPILKTSFVLSHCLQTLKAPIWPLFAYDVNMKLFTQWLTQLLAESLGKRKNGSGFGPTPFACIGPNDQHSLLQLFMDGPNDKCVFFFSTPSKKCDFFLPKISVQPLPYENLFSHSLKQLLLFEKKATKLALSEQKRFVIDFECADYSENTLGEMFLFFEILTHIIGIIHELNPFDQPGVELGKKLCKEMILNS